LKVKNNISNVVLCGWHIPFFKTGTSVVFTVSDALPAREHMFLRQNCTPHDCCCTGAHSPCWSTFQTRYLGDGLKHTLLFERMHISAVALAQQDTTAYKMNFLSRQSSFLKVRSFYHICKRIYYAFLFSPAS